MAEESDTTKAEAALTTNLCHFSQTIRTMIPVIHFDGGSNSEWRNPVVSGR